MIRKNDQASSLAATGAEFSRIMNDAVRRVQVENRQHGVPNVYSINGVIYYELPDGSLSREDPWHGKNEPPIRDDDAAIQASGDED